MKSVTVISRPTSVSAALLVVVLSALAVASCATSKVASSWSLIDLDKEWVSLYTNKLAKEQASPGAGASVNEALANLSKRAEEAGDAQSAGSPATAVGFYRVAATSAWQAVPNPQMLKISDKGAGVCDRLPNRDASQPRDCAFIRMAPLLAALDQKNADVRQLLQAGDTIPPGKLGAAETVTRDVADLMNQVVDKLTTSGGQSESFDNYVKFSLTGEFCTVQGLVGRFSASMPPEEQKERVLKAAREAQATLRNASISTTCN